jgi:hypothetical protein
VPVANRFRFGDNQNISPRKPKGAEQDLNYAILNSQWGAGLYWLECAQLLTQGKDLDSAVVAGTQKSADACEKSKAK